MVGHASQTALNDQARVGRPLLVRFPPPSLLDIARDGQMISLIFNGGTEDGASVTDDEHRFCAVRGEDRVSLITMILFYALKDRSTCCDLNLTPRRGY